MVRHSSQSFVRFCGSVPITLASILNGTWRAAKNISTCVLLYKHYDDDSNNNNYNKIGSLAPRVIFSGFLLLF